jgi:hypothetical protein
VQEAAQSPGSVSRGCCAQAVKYAFALQLAEQAGITAAQLRRGAGAECE